MTVPLQMFLKEKLFMKQILTCKFTYDLYIQLDRFVNTNSNDSSIPFSLIFMDSQAKILSSQ